MNGTCAIHLRSRLEGYVVVNRLEPSVPCLRWETQGLCCILLLIRPAMLRMTPLLALRTARTHICRSMPQT